jgi:CYTH domain-containing protein
MSMSNHVIRAAVSMEDIIDGKSHRELEYTFYAKVMDMQELEKAVKKEKHEQWNIPIETDKPVRQRIRLVDDRRHTLTMKVFSPGRAGADETTIDVSEHCFNALRMAGKDGYIKTRYVFPIPNSSLIWEIDVFLDNMGKPHPWVKIDLEIQNEGETIPEFPIRLEEVILDNGPKQSVREIAFVESLWKKHWFQIDRHG